MKNLIYKELKLVIPPIAYTTPLLAGFLLIPNYTYFIGFVYCLVGIYTIFQKAVENKDHEFTAMLPISRNHIVKAKFSNVMLMELLQMLIAIPFALITSILITPAGTVAGTDANFALFGFVFMEFAVFNIIFLPSHFKTGHNVDAPMVLAGIGYFVSIGLIELIVNLVPTIKRHIDSLSPENFVYQIPILAAGILIYIGGTLLSYRLSIKNFNKANL